MSVTTIPMSMVCLAKLDLDWGSKANLDGLLACTVKIVRRLILKISQISEWKETE